jgi:transcriptional regulator with XRE-family HTH domain
MVTDLLARREALGWTVAELSKRAGLDEKALGFWEQGIGAPTIAEVEQWAEALDMRLAVIGNAGTGAGLQVNWVRQQVTVDGAPVRLTPMEWKALERLAWAPGELVTHQDLFRHLYGTERHYRAQSTAVRVLITKLRRLLPLKIEAQWRRGYVVRGLEASRPKQPGGPTLGGGRPERAAIAPSSVPAKASCDLAPRSVPQAMPREPATSAPRRPSFGSANIRQVPTETRPNFCRDEELGVIERFLAERGATHCPDVATIQNQPLPTLVWDKVKRKWVRPATESARAG